MDQNASGGSLSSRHGRSGHVGTLLALPLAILLAVFLLALSVRWEVLGEARDQPQLEVPVLDARFYETLGAARAGGAPLPEGPFFMSPGYTWFVELHERLCGSVKSVRVTQVVLDSLTCVFTAAASYLLFGTLAGLTTGLLLALHGTTIFYALRTLPATLGTFLTALVLFGLVLIERAQREAGAGRGASRGLLFGVGLALGGAALVRSNVLLFVPLLLFGLSRLGCSAQSGPASVPARLRAVGRAVRLALFRSWPALLGMGLMILPATWHNVSVGGDRVLLTSSGGVNFYIGNAAGGDGRFMSLNQLPLAPGRFADDPTNGHFERSVAAYAEEQVGQPLSPSQVSRYWFQKTWSEIGERPVAWLGLLGRKLWLFFNAFEIPQIDNLYFMARYLPTLDSPLLYTSRLLCPLGLFGWLCLLWRRPRPLLPLLYLLAYAVSIALFFVTARYRLQAVPLLAFAAGPAVLLLGQRLLVPPRSSAVPLVVVLLVCFGVCNLNPGLGAPGPVRPASDSGGWFKPSEEFLDFEAQHNNMCARCLEWGDVAAAEAEIRAGLALNPLHPTLLYNLGRVLSEKEDMPAAAQALRKSLSLSPGNADAARLLGLLLYQMREYEEAQRALQLALKSDPTNPDTWNTLGGVRSKQGDDEAALQAFEQALRLAPGWDHPRYNRARLFSRIGRHQDALPDLERLTRMQPSNETYTFAYADALRGSGQLDESEQVVRPLLKRKPQHIGVLLLMAELELARQRPAEARAYLMRVLAQRPEHGRALELLRKTGE